MKEKTKFDVIGFDDSFVSIAEKINESNYSYSNEILYAACDGIRILPPAKGATSAECDRLSSVMLLIGRAYAASPERRKGAKKVNDGMITFFGGIANRIVSHPDYGAWRENIVEIAKQEYNYDGGQEDKQLLADSKDRVLELNRMLLDAIGQFDGHESSEDMKNCISFCTKLLHFMVPHIFYIKDSISWDAVWSLYGRQSNSELAYDERKLKIPRYAVGEAWNERYLHFQVGRRGADPRDSHEKEYWYHCRGCYVVSCLLKDVKLVSQTSGFNGIKNIYSRPRLVDSVLLHIHHDQEENTEQS